MNSLLLSDAYKQSHRVQYPKGTTLVYSNWTPRSEKYAVTTGGVVVFGIQAFFKKLNDWFNDGFFNRNINRVHMEFVKEYREFFGKNPNATHLLDLHKLGYLPIKVKALPEGSICPIGVPMLTIYNTNPKFFWLTNFLETIMSTELWQPMTSATIARGYKNLLLEWAEKTCDNNDHIPFQAHDFSMRGMAGLESAMASGAGHLTSFQGTDTIPAVAYVNKYYPGNKQLIGTSIPATEHSVMSMGTKDDEIGTFKKLITETYPDGFISIVSDTWNLWKVLTEYVPQLKEEILARDGKVVIRPDSGDPVDIICGINHEYKDSIYGFTGDLGDYITINEFSHKATHLISENFQGNEYAFEDVPFVTEPQIKGVIELLWDTFGGTTNSKGYKVLDPHIGAIYGDSITIERAKEICSRLEQKGFASSNVVFGVGSYTYQYNTRDTYGFAMKATYGEVLEDVNKGLGFHNLPVGREIFKDPVTDDGMKKSLKGLLSVKQDLNGYHVVDQCSWKEEEVSSLLELIYKNGTFIKTFTFDEIKNRLWKK